MERQKWFLLYSPLNQGLKPSMTAAVAAEADVFLLYSPLNQGLKPIFISRIDHYPVVFTLQSIKSRIETVLPTWVCFGCACFYSTVH